jgi:hypothetical protein
MMPRITTAVLCSRIAQQFLEIRDRRVTMRNDRNGAAPADERSTLMERPDILPFPAPPATQLVIGGRTFDVKADLYDAHGFLIPLSRGFHIDVTIIPASPGRRLGLSRQP